MKAEQTRSTEQSIGRHQPGCGCLDCVMPAEEFNAAIGEVADQDFSEERCAELERAGNWDADLLGREDEEDLREEYVIH